MQTMRKWGAVISIALMLDGAAAMATTTYPVGPFTFNTTDQYDNNFVKGGSGLITDDSANSRLLMKSNNAATAVYDTTATGATAAGTGGVSGTHANDDITDATYSANFTFTAVGSSTQLGYLMRLDDNGGGGYLALLSFDNTVANGNATTVRFRLFKGAAAGVSGGTAVGAGSVVKDDTVATSQGISVTGLVSYTYLVTSSGNTFAFQLLNANGTSVIASDNITDTSGFKLSGGQSGLRMDVNAVGQSEALTNYTISTPEPASVMLLAAPILLKRRRS